MKIETVTNGTVLNKRVKEMLVKFHPYLTISLDGPEIVHDRLRGRGSHRKTLRFINYLKNIDYENFEIASTYTRLHQKNGLSREDIFQYFTDMDVHFNINDVFTKNKNYIARVNNMIAGVAPIRHYQGQNLFFKRFSKDLEQALQEEVSYEKQRSLNSLFINSIDAFCSVAPIVIGGFMTYQNYLSAASFVGIYLVSHNIGYQFQELSYFINTRKSAKSLCDKYQDLFGNKLATDSIFDQSVFPIQLEQVSVEKDGETILAPCDLTIHAGEKIAIIGESGAGKTTLLNILYGEIHPSQGQIRYQGRELTSCQLYQAGAYILQSSHVFDDLSVEENIALGQEIDQQRMDNILQETGLLSLKGKVPSNQTLSGGEKQRLEIARALYHKRQFILADEVKANLDAKNQEKINQLLFSLPQAVVEVIHHYTKEDLKRYDKVIHLKK